MAEMRFRRWIAVSLVWGAVSAYSEDGCPESGRQLFYHPAGQLKEHFGTGFADTLFQRLAKPLENLGHCLRFSSKTALKDTSSDHLGLWVTAERSEETVRVKAAILPESQRSRANVDAAFLRPLTELSVQLADSAATASFLSQKIIENLRTQYVAQLNIETEPDSATIKTHRGLIGQTPLEWVLPLGRLHITVSHPGYLTREYDLDLSRPGEHTATLPLIKRRFYHSRLFPYTLAFMGTALVSYYMQNDFYNQYHQLGLEDQRERPEEFSRLFGIAQNWERATGASLVAALLSFGLSFRF